MDARLITLKLFLDALGIPDDISTVDDRKRVQKAVYLGQSAGVELGYRFGWYVMGPYSPGLTRDYYGLAEAASAGDEEYRTKELRRTVLEKLQGIRPVMTPPDDVDLTQEDWLELAASLHYLLKQRGLGEDDALRVLNDEKAPLAPFARQAEQELRRSHLLV